MMMSKTTAIALVLLVAAVAVATAVPVKVNSKLMEKGLKSGGIQPYNLPVQPQPKMLGDEDADAKKVEPKPTPTPKATVKSVVNSKKAPPKPMPVNTVNIDGTIVGMEAPTSENVTLANGTLAHHSLAKKALAKGKVVGTPTPKPKEKYVSDIDCVAHGKSGKCNKADPKPTPTPKDKAADEACDEAMEKYGMASKKPASQTESELLKTKPGDDVKAEPDDDDTPEEASDKKKKKDKDNKAKRDKLRKAISNAKSKGKEQKEAEKNKPDANKRKAAIKLLKEMEEGCGNVGEVGTVAIGKKPKLITFKERFENPVVFLGPPSSTTGLTTVPRMYDVSSTGFWAYLDVPLGLSHKAPVEKVSWLVMEAGRWQIEGAKSSIFVGKNSTKVLEETFVRTPMNYRNPVIMTQVQTVNTAKLRYSREVTSFPAGFSYMVESFTPSVHSHTREVTRTNKANEVVGYIYTDAGVVDALDVLMMSGHLKINYGTNNAPAVSLPVTDNAPVTIASLFIGPEPGRKVISGFQLRQTGPLGFAVRSLTPVVPSKANMTMASTNRTRHIYNTTAVKEPATMHYMTFNRTGMLSTCQMKRSVPGLLQGKLSPVEISSSAFVNPYEDAEPDPNDLLPPDDLDCILKKVGVPAQEFDQPWSEHNEKLQSHKLFTAQLVSEV
eukprot:GFYU01010304.1.p1 GENE.GFYU01010304.1~~GFYU01010304.1.p1  ORF type:complete len:666 (-),score=228.42 GFYU01010304.1:118-2115(-)